MLFFPLAPQAWTGVGEGLKAPEYQEFVDRWGAGLKGAAGPARRARPSGCAPAACMTAALAAAGSKQLRAALLEPSAQPPAAAPTPKSWLTDLHTHCRLQSPPAPYRWGNKEFAAYCVALAAQADAALAAAGPEERAAAEASVRRALKLELDFWSMAYAG
jgi:hypothetical protein